MRKSIAIIGTCVALSTAFFGLSGTAAAIPHGCPALHPPCPVPPPGPGPLHRF